MENCGFLNPGTLLASTPESASPLDWGKGWLAGPHAKLQFSPFLDACMERSYEYGP